MRIAAPLLLVALLLGACTGGDTGSDEDRALNAAAAATDINASTNVADEVEDAQ